MEQKYFSKKETAIMLGVHPRTVERYLLDGMLSGARFGKEWKISKEDIETFYEDAKAQTKKALNERRIAIDANADTNGLDANSGRKEYGHKKGGHKKSTDTKEG